MPVANAVDDEEIANHAHSKDTPTEAAEPTLSDRNGC